MVPLGGGPALNAGTFAASWEIDHGADAIIVNNSKAAMEKFRLSMQHIEEAGIHSGDSSCVLPAVDIPADLLDTMRDYTFKLARALKVIGLMNIQFAIPRSNGNGKGSGDKRKVYVLEVNPRASRTVPYVSKATGVPMAKIASRLMTGRKLREFLPENIERRSDLDTGSNYYVKSPVFPWNKFPGVDTVLGPEMRSTGEVMEYARQFCPPNKAAKAVGRIKRAVQTGWEIPMESALAVERENQQILFQSDDAKEGLAAYVEKRPAEFKAK